MIRTVSTAGYVARGGSLRVQRQERVDADLMGRVVSGSPDEAVEDP